jgi:hypothetical protein
MFRKISQILKALLRICDSEKIIKQNFFAINSDMREINRDLNHVYNIMERIEIDLIEKFDDKDCEISEGSMS